MYLNVSLSSQFIIMCYHPIAPKWLGQGFLPHAKLSAAGCGSMQPEQLYQALGSHIFRRVPSFSALGPKNQASRPPPTWHICPWIASGQWLPSHWSSDPWLWWPGRMRERGAMRREKHAVKGLKDTEPVFSWARLFVREVVAKRDKESGADCCVYCLIE